MIHTEQIAVAVYTKARTSKPILSGVLANNRTSYICYLQADQEVTTPTGVAKNDGFASVIAYTNDNINYFLNIALNHDLDQTVTQIHLHAPAASNTPGIVVYDFTSFLVNGAKALNIPVNASVMYWLDNSLGYINIHTSKNTAGALRGQVIPTTTRRRKIPVFPNGATVGTTTALPDGGAIIGDVGLNLIRGGAKNLTGVTTDPRVVEFQYITGGTFNNSFRFPLPVTIKNRHVLRSAVFYGTAAGELNDTLKYNFGFLNLDTLLPVNAVAVIGAGRRVFKTYYISLDADNLSTYLGPAGLFVTVQATGVSSNLYVDQFFVDYYISNTYANNILKAIFYKGSDIQK
jgi:hypothetical protein